MSKTFKDIIIGEIKLGTEMKSVYLGIDSRRKLPWKCKMASSRFPNRHIRGSGHVPLTGVHFTLKRQ